MTLYLVMSSEYPSAWDPNSKTSGGYLEGKVVLRGPFIVPQLEGDERELFISVIDKYLFETLGLQRKCRVHKDYMITPYIMDNWFIF